MTTCKCPIPADGCPICKPIRKAKARPPKDRIVTVLGRGRFVNGTLIVPDTNPRELKGEWTPSVGLFYSHESEASDGWILPGEGDNLPAWARLSMGQRDRMREASLRKSKASGAAVWICLRCREISHSRADGEGDVRRAESREIQGRPFRREFWIAEIPKMDQEGLSFLAYWGLTTGIVKSVVTEWDAMGKPKKAVNRTVGWERVSRPMRYVGCHAGISVFRVEYVPHRCPDGKASPIFRPFTLGGGKARTEFRNLMPWNRFWCAPCRAYHVRGTVPADLPDEEGEY